jgi:hypothetical protein
MDFIFGEIGVEAASGVDVHYEDGQPVFIARQSAQHIRLLGADPLSISLDPPGQPNCERLNVSLSIDHQRRLRLTVIDLLSGETLLRERVAGRLSAGGLRRRSPLLWARSLDANRLLSTARSRQAVPACRCAGCR